MILVEFSIHSAMSLVDVSVVLPIRFSLSSDDVVLPLRSLKIHKLCQCNLYEYCFRWLTWYFFFSLVPAFLSSTDLW